MKKIYQLITIPFFLLILLMGCKETVKDKTPWQNLFDGETLNGWTQKGGKANYKVVNGTIIGITVHNTPNSFLTTDKMYGDFILELDYKVDSTMNSGIQIRSNSFPHYRNGVVHGYQVEIDPSKRAWSAGIYDESRRGWLNTLKNNPKAQIAFKQNQWNHYRIEVIGDTLKTWINNVPAAYLIDDRTTSGFIGLQVHNIPKDHKEGAEIIWKNIKILTQDLNKYKKPTTLTPVITKNRLIGKEKEKGWKMLWDGESTVGWRGAKLESFPKSGWVIESGELTVLASEGKESEAGGDIVTKGLYGNFELKLDFKITEGANSGVKYFVNTNLNKGAGSSIGLEYQILDDDKHPDAKKGNHEGSRTLASLYDLIKAKNKTINPIGEWNFAHIISNNNHVEHWLNGIKVLEYERKNDSYRKLVAESKYKDWKGFGEANEGNISLQDHGNRVSFRNIKIRVLPNHINQ